MKKLIIVALISAVIQAAQPVKYVTKNALDVVTPVKPVQAIIAAYIGNVSTDGALYGLLKQRNAEYSLIGGALNYVPGYDILEVNSANQFAKFRQTGNDHDERTKYSSYENDSFESQLTARAFSQNYRASSYSSSVIAIYDMKKREKVTSIMLHDRAMVYSLTVYPDQNISLVAAVLLNDIPRAPFIVALYDIGTGMCVYSTKIPKCAGGIAFSGDKKYLFYGRENCIEAIDPITYKFRFSFPAHDNNIVALACSPDGKFLASAGVDGYVKIWDIASRKCVQVITESARALTFSFDNRYFAMGNTEGTVAVLELKTVLEWKEAMPIQKSESATSIQNKTECVIL